MKPNYPEQFARLSPIILVNTWPGVDVYLYVGDKELRIQHGSSRLKFCSLLSNNHWVWHEEFKRDHPLLAPEVMQFCETYMALTS